MTEWIITTDNGHYIIIPKGLTSPESTMHKNLAHRFKSRKEAREFIEKWHLSVAWDIKAVFTDTVYEPSKRRFI